MAKSGRKFEPGNFAGRGFADPHVLSQALDASATFEYIEWLRQEWPGKILVKGIMDADDALAAFKAGADGISISNHGGVQLRSEEHTSELQSLMRISYAVFCLNKKKPTTTNKLYTTYTHTNMHETTLTQ